MTTQEPHHAQQDVIHYDGVDIASVQIGDPKATARTIGNLVGKRSFKNHELVVMMDENGPWMTGVPRDSAQDPNHFYIRSSVLWPALLSGAAGVEWCGSSILNDFNCPY